jgi:hypothetical protein
MDERREFKVVVVDDTPTFQAALSALSALLPPCLLPCGCPLLRYRHIAWQPYSQL